MVRDAAQKHEPRGTQQTRRRKQAATLPKIKREGRKEMVLAARLIRAAKRADNGLVGTNVTDMSSQDFIAFLRSR